MALLNFLIQNTWTGNKGVGTIGYQAYERSHTVSIEHKKDILCSTDVHFNGDGTLHNPEDFFVSALSTCHMLWYLHLCADAGVVVVSYTDKASGVLDTNLGKFIEVVLNPVVTVTSEGMVQSAYDLHHHANKKCFIANSVNFEILHRPTINVKTI